MRKIKKYFEKKKERDKELILLRAFIRTKNRKFLLFLNKKSTQFIIRKRKVDIKNIPDLLENKVINEFEGLLYVNKKGFNSFFYDCQLDVVFCTKEGKVINMYQNMKMNDVTKYHQDSFYVYVFRQNAINYLDIKVNDYLKLQKIY